MHYCMSIVANGSRSTLATVKAACGRLVSAKTWSAAMILPKFQHHRPSETLTVSHIWRRFVLKRSGRNTKRRYTSYRIGYVLFLPRGTADWQLLKNCRICSMTILKSKSVPCRRHRRLLLQHNSLRGRNSKYLWGSGDQNHTPTPAIPEQLDRLNKGLQQVEIRSRGGKMEAHPLLLHPWSSLTSNCLKSALCPQATPQGEASCHLEAWETV